MYLDCAQNLLQPLQLPGARAAAQFVRRIYVGVYLLQVIASANYVLACRVPIIYLYTNEDTDHNDEHFNDDHEPVLLRESIGEAE